MLNKLFSGLFDTASTQVISVPNFLLCVGVSLVIGLIIALCYMYRTRFSKSFVATLALLPAIVCVIIMMVNGNIGAGVAVAGAFGLVRFRSMPGSAREIGALFAAMAAGLIAGMGYLAYAILFAAIIGLGGMALARFDFGAKKNTLTHRTLRVTIPEDLDYTGLFDDLFDQYTVERELKQVKTTNMGSLFRLTYDLTLKDAAQEKALIDQMRCRNGNLEISVSTQDTTKEEL